MSSHRKLRLQQLGKKNLKEFKYLRLTLDIKSKHFGDQSAVSLFSYTVYYVAILINLNNWTIELFIISNFTKHWSRDGCKTANSSGRNRISFDRSLITSTLI